MTEERLKALEAWLSVGDTPLGNEAAKELIAEVRSLHTVVNELRSKLREQEVLTMHEEEEKRRLQGQLADLKSEWDLADTDASQLEEENAALRALLREAQPVVKWAAWFQSQTSYDGPLKSKLVLERIDAALSQQEVAPVSSAAPADEVGEE